MIMFDPRRRAKKVFTHIDQSDTIKKKPEAVIIANSVEPHLDASFFYITGFPYGLFEGSYLICKRNEEITLITSPLEQPIALDNSKHITVYAEYDNESIRSRMKRILGSRSITIGLNSAELNYKSFLEIRSTLKQCRFVDVSEAFEAARMVKDAKEIELIQKACNIASRIYEKIPPMLRTGKCESDISAKMAYEMQKLGASGVSFETIVAFGRNSSQPHYSGGASKLKRGDFVLCDYGARYKRYCSDITRTMIYGTASKKQLRMYEVVSEAQKLGIELCTKENSGEYVHSKVSEFINSTEYKGRFTHGTGHSLGLAVHDGPGLSKRYKKNLQPGMIVTVEPGIYIPEIGGVRIEDDVLITKNKPRIMTSATRELIEV